ncbi:MAG: hypothetical protein AB1782_10605, partial [Cyanobacteriota bacterium]
MAYNHLKKINIFNLSDKKIQLNHLDRAYKEAFDFDGYDGIKPYIEIYLLKVRKDLPITISFHRTSRILDCSRYETSFSSLTDGFNIYINCHEFADNDYLSWLACKCIKHIEILLNRENYNFVSDKDELSKKRVLPQKEFGVCNRNWKKDARDVLSIEILTGQFAKDITGNYYTLSWKKEQFKKDYDLSKYNPKLIKTKQAQNLMKTIDLYELKLVEAFKKAFFNKYYEKFDYPENELWLRDKAWRLFKASHFNQSIETLNQLIKINQHNEEYHRLKGTCYIYLRDYKNSIESLNTAIFNDPNEPEGWYIKANCFYKLANYQQ